MDPSVPNIVAKLLDAQTLGALVGTSPAFLRAIELIPVVAKSEATILITGETGTGKELVAHAIHYLSNRATHPFVPVNCGSLPDTLLEDELFGHERGAFTDARSRREGLLGQAEKGTIFLDEVDSLTPRAQVALLRLLQDRRFRPLGSSRQEQADVRFLAASNAALEQLVAAGAFRADLYYRLDVVTLHLPPLRERVEDIPLLAAHFLEKHTPAGQPLPTLGTRERAALTASSWPGNVRELENTILRGLVLRSEDAVRRGEFELPAQMNTTPGTGASTFHDLKQRAIADFERRYLTSLLAEFRGNLSQAARAAGKDRRELGRLLKKYRLDRKVFARALPSSNEHCG